MHYPCQWLPLLGSTSYSIKIVSLFNYEISNKWLIHFSLCQLILNPAPTKVFMRHLIVASSISLSNENHLHHIRNRVFTRLANRGGQLALLDASFVQCFAFWRTLSITSMLRFFKTQRNPTQPNSFQLIQTHHNLTQLNPPNVIRRDFELLESSETVITMPSPSL